MTHTTVCVSVCKCVAWCTVNTVTLSKLTPPLLSWRPFSIPHDSLLICCPEETETAERCVCMRACMCVWIYANRQNQPIVRWDSSCTWWQAVTGLIIRRQNLNPTCYIIHITRYRWMEERSHAQTLAHGEKKDQCCAYVLGSVKCRMFLQSSKLLIIEPVDLNLTMFSGVKCFLFAFLKLC